MVCSAIVHLTDEILCSLHVHLSVAAGISKKTGEEGGMRASTQPCKRISALFDHHSVCFVCVRVYTKVKPAAGFTDLFRCHMRSPRLTLVHNAVPSETWPASLCR